MVNTISDLATQAFLSAQKNKPSQNGSRALVPKKANNAAKQAIMQQLDQTAEQGKNLMQRSATANAIASSPAPDRNLPRGSLIDIIV